MASLTAQSARVPLGMVMVGNQQVPVFITPEWFRYISVDAFRRMGEYEAMTNIELEEHTNLGGITPPPVQQQTAAEDYAPQPMAHIVPAPDDLTPPQATFQQETTPDPSGRLEALEAAVSALQQEIDSIKQGYQL